MLELVSSQCKEPENLDDIKHGLYIEIFKNNLLGKATYSVIPEIRDSMIDSQKGKEPDRHQFSTRLHGKPKCRPNGNRHGSSVSERSTCNWYYAMDVDSDRDPKIMIKARCSCTECKGGTCQPVSTLVPVIRRRCALDYASNTLQYEYFTYMEEVPVGCTCMRAKVTS